MSLTHKTSLVYITWVTFYSGEKGTLYKEMQASGVVTHPGFLSLPLPCLSLWLSGILLGPNLNTYCMKASQINNKQVDRQNLLEPSFLELWQLFKFYFTPPRYFLHCCVLITTLWLVMPDLPNDSADSWEQLLCFLPWYPGDIFRIIGFFGAFQTWMYKVCLRLHLPQILAAGPALTPRSFCIRGRKWGASGDPGPWCLFMVVSSVSRIPPLIHKVKFLMHSMFLYIIYHSTKNTVSGA